MKSFDELTPLPLLNIPHWECIVAEHFHLLPMTFNDKHDYRFPQTVGELLRLVDIPIVKLNDELSKLQTMTKDILISPDEFSMLLKKYNPLPAGYFVLDVSQAKSQIGQFIPGMIRVGHVDFNRLFDKLKESQFVVCVSDDYRSLSAAMYLRTQGIKHARALSL